MPTRFMCVLGLAVIAIAIVILTIFGDGQYKGISMAAGVIVSTIGGALFASGWRAGLKSPRSNDDKASS